MGELACGTPVAAFRVQGQIEVVGGSGVAVLDEDARKAAAAFAVRQHSPYQASRLARP